MNQINAIIIDDEAPARRRIKKLLGEFANIEIVAEAESGKAAIHTIKKHLPALLFLDIQLKDMTGFDVLKSVKPVFSGAVIFITAFDEYAIKAFEEHALDYLLKPFKNDRFKESLQRVLESIASKNQPTIQDLMNSLTQNSSSQKTLQIAEGKVIHYLDAQEISHIHAEGYYCNFYANSKPKTIRTSLKKLEESLPHHFVRINRSVMINKNKISSIKKLKKTVEIQMINGDEFTAFFGFDELF